MKNVDELGRPYRWVQWLCGLEFLEADPSKVSVSLSRSHMSETVDRLRARVSDRLSLQKQLAALGLSSQLLLVVTHCTQDSFSHWKTSKPGKKVKVK